MIRILHVLTAMDRAGTETMLMNYYRIIDRDEIQFDFAVTAERKCDYDDEIIALGGKIYHYPRYRGVNHFAYKKWWNEFFKEHSEYKIIHGHIGSTAAIFLSIAKKHGCYTIAHSHGIWGKVNVRSLIWRMYSYRTRYVANHFFGCSKDALVARYGRKVANDPSKAEVLRNAIDASLYIYDPDVRFDVRKELGLEDDELVVGTVGRLSQAKNPLFVCNLIAELKKLGVKFRFLWAGDGEMKDQIMGLISSHGLEDSVVMLGARNDIPRLLQAYDVFVFPSVNEGLGIAAIESQAAGVPTICSTSVPAEVKVTDLCSFLSLDNISLWTDKILSFRDFAKSDQYDNIVRAGYEIKEAAVGLTDFYKGVYRK